MIIIKGLFDIVNELNEDLDDLLKHLQSCGDDPEEMKSYITTSIQLIKDIKEKI